MTKLELHFDLVRPLTDEDAPSISEAHAVYGIGHVKLAPTMDALTVEYDASRLSEKDVENWLIRMGLPLRRNLNEVVR